MNAAAHLSGQLLQAFEEEEAHAAAQAAIKREPMSGRLHHDQPFGGGEPSEMSFETLDSEQDNSIASNSGFQRRGLNRTMSQTTNGGGGGGGTSAAWATHPSVANRAASVAFGADQPDIKPLLGWYGEDAGEESMRQLATMQAKLNQRLGPEYVSSRAGPGGGPKLHYLEGWKAIDLANDVFGFNGWSTNLVRLDTDFIDISPDGSRCNVGVSAIMRVTLRDGTFHEDIGYGHIENAKGKAAALEKAKKEAVTDALKRSLRTFGRLVGNCMYDKKYLETVSKMRPDAQKYDVTQLHRRTDSNAPPPPAMVKEEQDTSELRADVSTSSVPALGRAASSVTPRTSLGASGAPNGYQGESVGNASTESNVLRRSNTTALSSNNSNSDGRPSAAEQDRIRAERQALAAERQAAFRARQEEQRLLAAQASEQKAGQSGLHSASADQSGPSNASRPSPQLKCAPPAPVEPLPPKAAPESAAGRVYGKEPGAKWARNGAAAAVPAPAAGGLQVRPDTAQMMEGIDDGALSKAAETLEGSRAQAMRPAAKAQAQPPAPPRRAPSAGRFVSPSLELEQTGAAIGGVTSLSSAAGHRSISPATNLAGGVKRTGNEGLSEPREPLRALEVDDGGSVKRQKR